MLDRPSKEELETHEGSIDREMIINSYKNIK